MDRKYIDQAANAFMTIGVSISRWSGVAQLIDGAERAAIEAGADTQSTRMYFNILGQHHAELKAVSAAFAAIRTYLYENTLPFSQSEGEQQKRGDRLIPVVRVPEVITELAAIKAKAYAALEEFLPNYDRFVQASKANDVGAYKKEINFPSADEIRAKFAARISAPKAIPVTDMERFGSLPAGMAKEIAEANIAAISRQLAGAKDAAVEQAEIQMTTVVKQLTDGKRLSPSLIENSRHAAKMLRDMVEGYDNDPRLLGLADLIDEKIGTVADTDVWKNNETQRIASAKAAATVVTSIQKIRKAEKAVATPVKSGVKKSQLVGGGLIADLLD